MVDGVTGGPVDRRPLARALRAEDVVEAVGAGRVHVHAVADVDAGPAVLSGREAGVRGADGQFPAGSFNRAIDEALAANAARRKEITAR